jgi:hypothetical protein
VSFCWAGRETNSPQLMSKRSRLTPGIAITDSIKKIAGAALRSVPVLLCLAVPGIGHATLGENVQSTETDRTSMMASMRMLPATSFTIQELQTPSGTTIREFVSPSGVVFAIAWRGPTMPDLKQALGRYFDRYATSDNKQGGLHNRVISDSDLVVQSSGRMRLFTGRAYVPQLLPSGVTPDQIR